MRKKEGIPWWASPYVIMPVGILATVLVGLTIIHLTSAPKTEQETTESYVREKNSEIAEAALEPIMEYSASPEEISESAGSIGQEKVREKGRWQKLTGLTRTVSG